MNTVKVIHVNRTLNRGGIESFLANLAAYGDKSKTELAFMTLENQAFDLDEEIKMCGCELIKTKKTGRFNKLGLILKTYGVFKRVRPDVVHCHVGYDSAFILLAAKLAGINIRVVHSHTANTRTGRGQVFWKPINWLRRKMMFGVSTDLLACSKKAGEALFGRGTEFMIIRNGIDLAKFGFDASAREKVRDTLGIRPNEVVVGHVGRLDTPKNHEFLLDIFKKIVEDSTGEEYRLILVGDGPLRTQSESRARELGIYKQVLFLGSRGDAEKLYSAFDMVIFPSIFEGLPITLVEAQANGLPVLASDAIAPEIKLTDSLEFYSLDKTAEEWAKKARTLARKSTSSSKLREYSIENTIKELQKVYEGGDK